MKKFKIFLASALEELHEDRFELRSFIQCLNNQCVKQELYLRPFMCENEDIAMSKFRKQDDYNENICESHLIIVLVWQKLGKYTEEEFNVAYRNFKENGAPDIKIFFRDCGSRVANDVKEFQYALKNEKGINYQTYTDILMVKQDIWEWLQNKLNLDFTPQF